MELNNYQSLFTQEVTSENNILFEYIEPNTKTISLGNNQLEVAANNLDCTIKRRDSELINNKSQHQKTLEVNIHNIVNNSTDLNERINDLGHKHIQNKKDMTNNNKR